MASPAVGKIAAEIRQHLHLIEISEIHDVRLMSSRLIHDLLFDLVVAETCRGGDDAVPQTSSAKYRD